MSLDDARKASAAYTKAEGDEIARLVLKLVKAITNDPTAGVRTAPEPVHTSPMYRSYEQLINSPKAG